MKQLLSPQTFHFKEFSNLDSSPDADYLINSMETMHSLESIQAIKKNAIKAMRLQTGSTVLEVGCGHGYDAETIGQIVGETGSVIAIDTSHRMINMAKKNSDQKQVKYLVADINDLEIENQYFSACHADRFLVSYEDYKSVFKKILRMVKPGGMVCFTDVDALSIIISPYNKQTECIVEQLHKGFVNPYMGRELPSLFIQHKLEDLIVFPETSLIRSWKTLNEIFQFSKIAKSAINAKTLTQEEVEEWKKNMEKADQEGNFLYCITFFTVLGRVPDGRLPLLSC